MWGVVHHGLRKKYSSDARAMALEYGSAAHEVFAAIYLWQVGYIQNLPDHMFFHAGRIFKDELRFRKALQTTDASPDNRDRLISLGYNILHSGNFYDDPYDNIRTIANLELGIVHYVDHVINDLPRWPIYIHDEKDPTKPIGIEFPIDIILCRTLTKSSQTDVMRYIGQIDRFHEIERDGVKEIILGENKTGSRLGDSWSMALDMSHQITGYIIGLYTMLGRPVTKSRVHGLKSKQTGHADDYNPISPQPRTTEMFETFIDWALHSRDMYELYSEENLGYESAPRYTHSCNRYFRPCSLLSFCCDTIEGRREQLSQMVGAELSPSEQAVMDRISNLE